MMTPVSSLLSFQRDRAFIDVGVGCGSGCAYCYTAEAKRPQRLAAQEELDQVCQAVEGRDIRETRIVSFCPNTEPFKSSQSAALVLSAMERLARPERCFQISTKEKVPDEAFPRLAAVAKTSPVFLNVSIPILRSQEKEPNAASVADRVGNLRRGEGVPGLYRGLYIKPLFQSAFENLPEYRRIIQDYQPDYVCVGVLFSGEAERPCESLYEEAVAPGLIAAQGETVERFAQNVRAFFQGPVVYSSVCAVYRLLKLNCGLALWDYGQDSRGWCHLCPAKAGGQA